MTVMATERRPYDPEHVLFVDSTHRRVVRAVWTPDPAATAETVGVLDSDVEWVASLKRVYKQDGSRVSGWILTLGDGDPLESGQLVATNRRDAMKALRQAVIDAFKQA